MRGRKSYCVRIFKGLKVPLFEYLYMVVMVIYMAQINETTARMVGGLSGNPIPFLIPIILTCVLLWRNRISLQCRNLNNALGLFAVWAVLVLIKFSAFSNTADLSYVFFLFYAIIIAFVHVRVFKKNFFYIYEHIIVWLSIISIPFWLMNNILFGIFEPSFLPETSLGYNVIYIYNWISPHFDNIDELFLITMRNSGFSWEPGRFAVIINLAMFINLSYRGIKFRDNKNMLILLIALATTQSTTGYLITIFLFLIFAFKFRLKNIMYLSFILVVSLLIFTRLDFMKDKILEQLDLQDTLMMQASQMEYHNRTLPEGEYVSSVGRFQSILYDTLNFLNDPLLGYSRNVQQSYFYNDVSSHYSLPSGIIKVFAQFGIIVGLCIYYLLIRSSFIVSTLFPHPKKWALAVVLIASLVSYDIWLVPVIMDFWMFGLFYENNYKYKKINEKLQSDNHLK